MFQRYALSCFIDDLSCFRGMIYHVSNEINAFERILFQRYDLSCFRCTTYHVSDVRLIMFQR